MRMALGETHVIALTKRALGEAGVDVEALEGAAAASGKAAAQQHVERSGTALLVKNLPYTASEAELQVSILGGVLSEEYHCDPFLQMKSKPALDMGRVYYAPLRESSLAVSELDTRCACMSCYCACSCGGSLCKCKKALKMPALHQHLQYVRKPEGSCLLTLVDNVAHCREFSLHAGAVWQVWAAGAAGAACHQNSGAGRVC